ncbi:hypothetical protein ACIRRA_10670 [Nocardia sp. NPDC101769]|uniref:hypothetical protein n=1 Tax=Nocardia sp. NPDC101769 TaxID=3364333 RepID=UPI0038291BF8
MPALWTSMVLVVSLRLLPPTADRQLLPGDLVAVIAMGKAQSRPAWNAAIIKGRSRFHGAEVFFTAHPSPLSVNQVDKHNGRFNRDHIAETFARVASLLR